MNISVNSWHYKLIDFFGMTHPKSLCPYFWTVVWSVLLAAALLFALTYPIHQFFWGSDVLLSILSSVTWVLAGAWLRWVLYELDKLGEPIFKFERKPRPHKEPGVLLSYLKAKKEKMCPRINFTE